MVQINFALKEVSCKIVYYGPGLSGKTTNLQRIHEKIPAEHKGKLTSIATEDERTLFFDFLPLDLGSVAGMRTKFQLYTVPGQVYYNATRRLVLRGVDGLVFVADSQPEMMAENLQSWQNLQDNLAEHGLALDDVPVVFQYNKRDLPNAVPVQLMNDRLNAIGAPWYEACATEGSGVLKTLRGIAGLVLDELNKRETRPAARRAAPAQRAAAAEAPVKAAAATATVNRTAPPLAAGTATRTRDSAAAAAAPVAPPPRSRVAARPVPAEPPPRPARSPAPVYRDEGMGSGSRGARPRKRRRAWIAVAAGLLVAASAVAAFLFFGG